MLEDRRVTAVRRMISDYVESPSLRHVRDPKSVFRLAEQIVRAFDREPTIWKKWEGLRESLLESAALCWIPVEDLQEALNAMPGSPLTLTDVAQRLRAFHEERYSSYPNEKLRNGCLAIYRQEKESGTELPAIIGKLQEFVEAEEERLRDAHQEDCKRRREEDRIALEQRFLSGADCKWTRLGHAPDLYVRKNGRAYRLRPTKEKRWDLYRIKDNNAAGAKIGTYGSRGDASKAIEKIAFEPEPRW